MTARAKKSDVESKKAETMPIQRAVPMHAVSPFDEMEERMAHMFDDFFPGGWMRPFHFGRHMMRDFPRFEMKVPNVDIIDHDNEVVLEAELPGIEKEDVEVSVDKNAVTISGKTNHEDKAEKGNYYRSEIRHGSFIRTIVLPWGVDGTKAKASFKNGILEVTLPKLERSKRLAVKVQ